MVQGRRLPQAECGGPRVGPQVAAVHDVNVTVALRRNGQDSGGHAEALHPGRRLSLGRTLGFGAGKPSIIDEGKQKSLVDVVRRRDLGNDGMSTAAVVNALGKLVPDSSREQLRRAWRRIVRPGFKSDLTDIIRAQATMTKRTAITVAQQWRWHRLMDDTLKKLRERNVGCCPKSGKTFGEVLRHFVGGGDETGMLASSGNVTIIGDKGKRKHESNKDDSRVSISMFRLGSAAGTIGPTGFLMSGKKKKTGFTDEFLVTNGATPGSSPHMTPTGFMTEVAWVAMAKHQVAGIRAMPVIYDNPDWWVTLIVDGSGPHIMRIKEEGDSSHVNQSYDHDQLVAKRDKAVCREALETLRRTRGVTKGVVDQWGLDHVGLAVVRDCPASAWAESFAKVNLDPLTRVGFHDWCIKIGHFLQGSMTFKEPDADDSYALLPPFWHGMEPSDKRRVVRIIDAHGDFTVNCVKGLHTWCHVPYNDIQNLRLCYEVAKEYPEHVDMTTPLPSAVTIAPEVAEAPEMLKPVTHGLASFHLKSEGLRGLELFEHMVKFKKCHAAGVGFFEAESRLDLAISDVQKTVFEPMPYDLTCLELMKDAGGAGATLKLAKRKLDALGGIKAYCGEANSDERIKKLERAAKLADSLAQISRLGTEIKTQEKCDAPLELNRVTPEALRKLQLKYKDVSKLKIKEIGALLVRYFALAVPKGAKEVHVAGE
ncbi:hypothetical protein M885DRAFT_590330 [Pelagophyceae sp. CCMP2097]|nr:hypothetical protein M885DRAFT_590330 [Pelagophyceae sp. CCMP2097]